VSYKRKKPAQLAGFFVHHSGGVSFLEAGPADMSAGGRILKLTRCWWNRGFGFGVGRRDRSWLFNRRRVRHRGRILILHLQLTILALATTKSPVESRGIHDRGRNMPLSRDGALRHRCRLPERNVLVGVPQLRRIRRLVDDWRRGIGGPRGSVPLVREVGVVLDSPAMQRILGRWRIAVIGRILAVAFLEESMEALAAVLAVTVLTIAVLAITISGIGIGISAMSMERHGLECGPGLAIRDADDSRSAVVLRIR
jgi:hypothetical protein